jgi:hypothetical protein
MPKGISPCRNFATPSGKKSFICACIIFGTMGIQRRKLRVNACTDCVGSLLMAVCHFRFQHLLNSHHISHFVLLMSLIQMKYNWNDSDHAKFWSEKNEYIGTSEKWVFIQMELIYLKFHDFLFTIKWSNGLCCYVYYKPNLAVLEGKSTSCPNKSWMSWKEIIFMS